MPAAQPLPDDVGPPARPPLLPFSEEVVASARRQGQPLLLMVDAAWSSVASSDTREDWAYAALPPGSTAAQYALADAGALPALALRTRWICRLFDLDDPLPHAVLLAVRRGDGRVLPLHALGHPLTADAHAARDQAVAAWASDRAALRDLAARRRRALVVSARRGWRASPTLERGPARAREAAYEALTGESAALHPTALRLLLELARADANVREPVAALLRRLAESALRDQLDGGFFRAARDTPAGRVPDFARTSASNAALLAVYSTAAAQYGDRGFAEVARGIGRYLLGTLRDRATGAFYAGQAPDESYYTWTSREMAAAVPTQCVQTVFLHYNVQPAARLLADPRKNVLYVANDLPVIAGFVGRPLADVRADLEHGRAALLAARAARPAPAFDRAVYVDANARAASSLLLGSQLLLEPAWRDAALETLDWVGQHTTLVGHDRPTIPHRLGASAPWSAPFLGDYAALGQALLDAHLATGEQRYLDEAETLTDSLLTYFREARSGTLLDTPQQSPLTRAFWPEQPLEDGADASPVALAASLLLALHRCTQRVEYRHAASTALRRGATAAGEEPLACAGYYLALAELLARQTAG